MELPKPQRVTQIVKVSLPMAPELHHLGWGSVYLLDLQKGMRNEANS
jgi:hypothetical protein